MSATRNYFQKFPSISYNDLVIRDISVRTKLTQYLTESGIALLPYTVKEGERADNIASFYYDDPYYAWAIYLVNGIVDPYSEWPKDNRTLNDYIEAAYGSAEAARDTILRYEVDWASDTTMLTPEQYSALMPEERKYWEASFGYNREIISYFRREVDWVLDNNRIDQITVVSNSSVNSLANAFTVGERTYQYNFLNDVAVKSTVISLDSTVDANTVSLLYTDNTLYDIDFESGNSSVFVKSSSKILPFAQLSGTNIPTGAYVKHIIDGTHVELSEAPTGSPVEDESYVISNPATATITVHKVDFSDVIFASTSVLEAPDSFFTYETAGHYRDEDNYLIGRSGGANVVVLTHSRLDTNTEPLALLSNSQLSTAELPYWKSINAYDEEVNKNELKKEIFVLDLNAIDILDNNLEALVKNV